MSRYEPTDRDFGWHHERRHSEDRRRSDRHDHDETVTIAGALVVHATDRAILVQVGGTFGDKLWVPKSVVHDDSDVWDNTPDARGPGDLLIAAWFAEKEGLCSN